jgi:transcription-repair coupling factor (superfamily II helicase)
MKTKLPVTQTIKFLNAIINSASKMAIRKTKYHFKELTTLSVGIMLRIDHGIGRFGVAKIQVEGKTQEAIKLVYADDIVYVSIHSLHKISKYNGKDGHQNIQTGFECLENFKTKNKARVSILLSI